MPSNAPHAPTTHARRTDPHASHEPVYAALDLGTNNCRLLIARSVPDAAPGAGLRVLDSFSRIVRLGEGISTTGNLSQAAMERTIAALHQCRRKLERYPVAHAGYVATEACRTARNAPEFLARVKKEAGIDIQIISPEEEAKLAFLGCAAFLKPEMPRALIFDIGGGSTELMWIARGASGPSPQIEDWLSIDKGVMNLAEKFGGPAFSDIYFEDIVRHLIQSMQPFGDRNAIAEQIEEGRVQLLSTSGTVTTLAAIHLGLPRYDRSKIDGITLSTKDLRRATRSVIDMRASERFAHPCIGPDRSDFILSGCAIFEAICTVWPLDHITIADRGVREGIIMSLIREHKAS